ncbi:MAG: hypothetical protein COV52_08905 [Gammaproteobacteria bacterium CG11_big_fil_rev_8_21_14_0_20_46_22]|nr:MAG: hypothetical protein COW05_01520 [Gammaproteobacteria bacterium CG12_big_fil_rev_8_21_14_0_65_46_12]PIR10396.1 MAG: hypothetical protein COV52_08905 [Gammaproteobacteria bacterium CG11_big_fil_rev_8_21_14_0_20_46_22]
MDSRRETDYFRIGVFVVIAIALIVIAIFAFTAGNLFSSRLYVETYFNESVQGLSPGSVVKYRGIDIGEVKKIKLVSAEYNLPENEMNSKFGRYIYVLLSLDPHFMPGLTTKELADTLREDVDEGLRVKMSLKALTGGAYVELNFADPGQAPMLPILWKPRYLYIPSETSTLTRVGDSVQDILNGLSKVDFQRLFTNMQDLVTRSNTLVTKVDNLLDRTQDGVVATVNNTQAITSRLRSSPSSLLFSKPQQVNPRDL